MHSAGSAFLCALLNHRSLSYKISILVAKINKMNELPATECSSEELNTIGLKPIAVKIA
jgi:hypothetical protein